MNKPTPGEWRAVPMPNENPPHPDDVTWVVLADDGLNDNYAVATCYGPDAQSNAKMIALVPYLLDVAAITDGKRHYGGSE